MASGSGRGHIINILKESKEIIKSQEKTNAPLVREQVGHGRGNVLSSATILPPQTIRGGRGMIVNTQAKEKNGIGNIAQSESVQPSISRELPKKDIKPPPNTSNYMTKPSSSILSSNRTEDEKEISKEESKPQQNSSNYKAKPTSSAHREDQELPQFENLSLTKDDIDDNMLTKASNKKGEKGNTVNMQANFLRLNRLKNYDVFEYVVKFSPDIESKGLCRLLLKEHASIIGETLIFDGNMMYLPLKLQHEITKLRSKHPSMEQNYDIQIKFIQGKSINNMVHVYNILFKRIMSVLKLKRFKRHFFNPDPQCSHIIPQYKLSIWPGYITAIEEVEAGVLLNMDPAHKILRTNCVLDDIIDCSKHTSNDHSAIKRFIIGRTVLTSYNHRPYTIDDVDFDTNPLSTFETKDGPITYQNYYYKNYGITIKNLKQPMLMSRSKQKIVGQKMVENLVYLVPELCNFTGLTLDMKEDHHLMKEMALYTRVTPNQRQLMIKKFINSVNNCAESSKLLSDWGLSISDEPVRLAARSLEAEKIIFKNNKIHRQNDQNANWNRETTLYPVIEAVDITNWVVLYTQRDAHTTKRFCETIVRCGQPAGIVINNPRLILLNSDHTEQFVTKLREAMKSGVTLVMCICPSSKDDRYSAIKRVCCNEYGIPSQVVNGPTIKKENRLRVVAHKVLLQMNCKLGGTLWSVKIPYENIMIVGLDVYHSTSTNAKSVCGFVASYDSDITRWYSRVCFQKTGQEIVDELQSCFFDVLKLYFATNGTFPNRIIVYRDGVGEGQLKICRDYEIKQLLKTFSLIDSTYTPYFTFVVVQKRNNTRIFEMNPRNQNLDNPGPGTIIDHTILKSHLYDFYLVSHKVRDATLIPTHYIVIYDSSDMTPDQVQRMTFKMCHLYYNWPGTIRVPSVCQYAHRLAYLVGTSLKCVPHVDLAKKLFFL